MVIKIVQHYMPWDLDGALLSLTQLKKSKPYLPEGVEVKVQTVLNLSSYIINWEKSLIPKEYFISKYNNLSSILTGYEHISKIYNGDKLYGHLNFQTEIISPEVEYYLPICPDICFSEYALSYLIQSALNIPNKYFVITPQIHKLWDSTWDEITNPEYAPVPYSEWDKVDVFDIYYNNNISEQSISLKPIIKSKFAGWFDLYNKAFYEELCPPHKDWEGYGPWDWYSMMLSEYSQSQGIDFQQYLLEGETIFEYPVGPLKDKKGSKLTSHYKKFLVLNDIPNQRQQFESNMQLYLNKGVQMLKDKKIL